MNYRGRLDLFKNGQESYPSGQIGHVVNDLIDDDVVLLKNGLWATGKGNLS